MIDVPFAAVLPIASEGHPTAAPSPSLCDSARRGRGSYGGTVLDPKRDPVHRLLSCAASGLTKTESLRWRAENKRRRRYRDLIIQLARAGEGDPERLCVGALHVLRK
jgi:hypothetical protein